MIAQTWDWSRDLTAATVLVVEDNPDEADLVRAQLAEIHALRLDCETERTLDAAVRRLQTRTVDLVLLDLDLAENDGLRSLTELRRQFPDVPVVVLTGDVRPEVRTAALNAGAEDYIGKNESRAKLLARCVLHALERHRSDALRARVDQMIANSRDGIVVTDADGRVLFVNAAASQMLGRGRTELLGQPVGFALEGQSVLELDGTEGPAGRTAALKVMTCDWRDAPAFLATLKAMTDRQQVADQLRHSQKLEAVGQLAGGVAHDFNNLLTVILACSEFALDDLPADHPVRAQIVEIQRAGRRAASLTQQLLTFARRRASDPQSVDLNDTVRGLGTMLSRLLGEAIEIELRLDPEVRRIVADPDQISQVLANLAVNARDAMPSGGRLTIETAAVELGPAEAQRLMLSPGPWIRLTVRDTGSGMDPDVVERVFEPFYTTKRGRGSGLGLAVVHGIITQGGGQVSVHSQKDQGTAITMHLPSPDAVGSPEPKKRMRPVERGGTERILLVEDEPPVREIVARTLRRHGYTVEETGDGRSALQRWTEEPGAFDLVLTDVVMPGMGGWELGQRLRDLQPDVRIIYMSGYSDEVMAQHGVTPARDLVLLQKPFAPRDLLTTLRDHLDR